MLQSLAGLQYGSIIAIVRIKTSMSHPLTIFMFSFGKIS